jgi:hypothetical protein
VCTNKEAPEKAEQRRQERGNEEKGTGKWTGPRGGRRKAKRSREGGEHRKAGRDRRDEDEGGRKEEE